MVVTLFGVGRNNRPIFDFAVVTVFKTTDGKVTEIESLIWLFVPRPPNLLIDISLFGILLISFYLNTSGKVFLRKKVLFSFVTIQSY